jgi:hypothetical protein
MVGLLSSLVLDLDGDGVDLKSRKKSGASFDMDGDGVADDTGWVGKGDGILVIDRNGDGEITGNSELSFLTEKTAAKSNLDALGALDSNRDGKLDATDKRFAELNVWIDANRNGVSDDGEIKALDELGISEISLASRASSQKLKVGASGVLATSTFKRTDGSVGTIGEAGLAFVPGHRPDSVSAIRRSMAGAFEPVSLGRGAGESVVSAQDRRVAQMVQAMSTFGLASGEGNMPMRSIDDARNLSFHAMS